MRFTALSIFLSSINFTLSAALISFKSTLVESLDFLFSSSVFEGDLFSSVALFAVTVPFFFAFLAAKISARLASCSAFFAITAAFLSAISCSLAFFFSSSNFFLASRSGFTSFAVFSQLEKLHE